jgi:hypothetical protein
LPVYRKKEDEGLPSFAYSNLQRLYFPKVRFSFIVTALPQGGKASLLLDFLKSPDRLWGHVVKILVCRLFCQHGFQLMERMEAA